jgi:hypothetical protein
MAHVDQQRLTAQHVRGRRCLLVQKGAPLWLDAKPVGTACPWRRPHEVVGHPGRNDQGHRQADEDGTPAAHRTQAGDGRQTLVADLLLVSVRGGAVMPWLSSRCGLGRLVVMGMTTSAVSKDQPRPAARARRPTRARSCRSRLEPVALVVLPVGGDAQVSDEQLSGPRSTGRTGATARPADRRPRPVPVTNQPPPSGRPGLAAERRGLGPSLV